MKRFLIALLLLVSLFAQAQVRPPASPPTLTYRQKNTNQLDMIISSAGTLLTPSSSLSITAEVRLSDVGRIVATVPMTTVDSVDGTIRGMLPNLDPSIYYLGLYVKYASGEPEFRVGIGRLEIVPTGSLRVVTDASGLNIQISEVRQVLNVKLDATPSSAIAAFYAAQARADVSLIVQAGSAATTGAASSSESAAAALNYKNAAATSAGQASAAKEAAQQASTDAQGYATQSTTKAGEVLTTKGQIDLIKTAIDNAQSDVTTKAGQVVANKTAVDNTKTAIDNIYNDVLIKSNATITAATNASVSEGNAHTSELNAANSALASVQAFKGAWAPSTAYATGDLVTNSGNTYRRKAAGTSASSFDSTQWDVIALGGSVTDGSVTEAKIDATFVTKIRINDAMNVKAEVMPNLTPGLGTFPGFIWSSSGTNSVLSANASFGAIGKIAMQPGDIITIEGLSSQLSGTTGRWLNSTGGVIGGFSGTEAHPFGNGYYVEYNATMVGATHLALYISTTSAPVIANVVIKKKSGMILATTDLKSLKPEYLPAEAVKQTDAFSNTSNLVTQYVDDYFWSSSLAHKFYGPAPLTGYIAVNAIPASPGQTFYIRGFFTTPVNITLLRVADANFIPITSSVATTALVPMYDGWWSITLPSTTGIAYVFFNFQKAVMSPSDLVIQTGAPAKKTLKLSLLPDGIWRNYYPNIASKLPNFRKKFTALYNKTADNPVRILLWGNSIFAREVHTTMGPVVPSAYPPGLTTNNFASYLWRNLGTAERPDYARYDAVGAFVETGTWSTLSTNAIWDDSGDRPTETRISSTASAAVSFSVTSGWNRFNFIDRTATDGAQLITISVPGGSGLLQVQLPGSSSYVEANGATFSQLEVDEGANRGNTIYQRRIYFKKTGAAIGADLAVALTKDGTSDKFMYWGLEKVIGVKPYVQLINTARGAHTFSQGGNALNDYILDDVADRKPDLVVVEIPIINMVQASSLMSDILNSVQDAIWGDRAGALNSNSLKNLSSNWSTFEVLLVMPHMTNTYNPDGSPIVNTAGYSRQDYWTAVKSLILEKGDVGFVDMFSAFKRASDREFGGNYYNATVGSGVNGNTYLSDGTHQNDKGTLIWAQNLCPIFDFNNN